MTSLETKYIRRYYRRGAAGGRSMLARCVDYAAIRLLIFLAALLFFRQRIEQTDYAALLAVLTLLLAMVLLRIARELRLERYTAGEKRRIRRLLLARSLAMADADALLPLARALCGGAEPLVLMCVDPVCADALLPCVRSGRYRFVAAPAGFTAAAEAFARQNGLELVSQGALLNKAEHSGLSPGGAAVDAYILSEESARQQKRRRLGGLPFMQGAAKKYLFTALVLFGLSFLTRYALYYRLLAAVCMSVFSVNFLLDRSKKAS